MKPKRNLNETISFNVGVQRGARGGGGGIIAALVST